MHILGGKLKGRKLAKCKYKSIRPAMALIRKSIFDTLKDFVIRSNVLDLCAGTGAVGIEAVSRGASKLTLIDSNINAIRIIRKNLDICKIKAKIIWDKLPESLIKLKNQKYNLIFLDPPYGESKFIESILKKLCENELLEKNGLILIEQETKSLFSTPDKLEIYKEKRFGNTKVIFLKYKL